MKTHEKFGVAPFVFFSFFFSVFERASGVAYQSCLAISSISSGVTRRRSSARVRTGGNSAGVRGGGVRSVAFVDRASTGIGTSLGDSGGNPFVDLTRRPGGGMESATESGERTGGRTVRAAMPAMRCASSGVNSGASFMACVMFTWLTCIKLR